MAQMDNISHKKGKWSEMYNFVMWEKPDLSSSLEKDLGNLLYELVLYSEEQEKNSWISFDSFCECSWDSDLCQA